MSEIKVDKEKIILKSVIDKKKTCKELITICKENNIKGYQLLNDLTYIYIHSSYNFLKNYNLYIRCIMKNGLLLKKQQNYYPLRLKHFVYGD